MAIYKPQVIADANIFLEGEHHLGVSSSVKLPVYEFLTDEQKAGGFARKLYTGQTELKEIEISLSVFSKMLPKIQSKAYTSSDKAEFLIKSSHFQDGKYSQIVANWKGGANVEYGELKAGGKVDVKIKINPVFIDLTIDGIQHYQIDSDNSVCIIDGKDLIADLRNQIM